MRDLEIGVIGAGRIGTLHANNLALRIPHTHVAMIADSRLRRAQDVATAIGAADAVDDYRMVLDNPRIQAVVICSSTDTHAQIIEEAAAKKKHIFCEKPIDHDLGRIQKALDAVDQASVLLQTGFNRRFDPDFRHVADQIRHGTIGQPHIVRITSRDPEPPALDYVRSSGGLFLDMSIHDFDMARYLVGEPITEVFAIGSNLIDPAIGAAGDLDTAVITLRYKSGAVCSIDNSRQAVYGYDQRLEVLGSQGCILAGNHTPNRVQIWNPLGQTSQRPHAFFLERYRESYIAEMREFVECIQHARPPSVNGQDGLHAAILAHAARESIEKDRPVHIDPVTGCLEAA